MASADALVAALRGTLRLEGSQGRDITMSNHPNRSRRINGLSITAFTSKAAYEFIKCNDNVGLDTTLDALTRYVDEVLARHDYVRPTRNTNFYIWNLRKCGLVMRVDSALFRPVNSARNPVPTAA